MVSLSHPLNLCSPEFLVVDYPNGGKTKVLPMLEGLGLANRIRKRRRIKLEHGLDCAGDVDMLAFIAALDDL
jgi:hypothetical protein